MIITITVQRDDTSDDADRLLPFLATADFREICARDLSPVQAVSTVIGIALHCLADFAHPPTVIRFKTIRQLPKESPPDVR